MLNTLFVLYGRPKGSALLGIAFIAVVSVISVLAERYYDRPVRHWLTAITRRRPKDADRTPVAAATAAPKRGSA